MNDTYKQLQALKNPYPHCQTSAHAWDMAIAEAMRIAAAPAPTAPDETMLDSMQALDIWDAALTHAAMYVASHCVDGDRHADAIVSFPKPKVSAAPSDAERLDWLEKSNKTFCGNYSGSGFRMIGSAIWHGTLREAIDGAMQEK